MFIYIFVIIVFLAGLYFYTVGYNNENANCPDMLVQKNGKLYLYNSKTKSSPVIFNNLEDYINYLEAQRKTGINCPVLYLQNTFDTQGNQIFKIRPSPTDPQGGLPPNINNSSPANASDPNNNTKTDLIDATHSDMPYNINSMPGYDPTSFYQGKETPLDKKESLLHSPNPMDNNWGGQKFTQSLVDKGYYKDNEVSMRV